VRVRPRRVRTAVLTVLLASGASRVAAQESEPSTQPAGPGSDEGSVAPDDRPLAGPVERASGDETSAPPWPYSPRPRPIRESVERVVARVIQEHSPCGPAGEEGVPCFPVLVELEAPEYSVRDSLRNMQLDDRPMPGPPTAAEMNRYGANPLPASATVGFDPICKTKQLVRKIFGRGQTYYVYRVWDHTGERAVLRDRPMAPEEFAGAPQFHYESLGRFGDECEALKAYRKAMREARRTREGEGPGSGDEGSEERRGYEDPE
jgi:hypothetical protein